MLPLLQPWLFILGLHQGSLDSNLGSWRDWTKGMTDLKLHEVKTSSLNDSKSGPMLKLTIHQYQLNLAESWSRWRLGIWCSISQNGGRFCFQQHQPWAFCPQDASPRSNIAAGMPWHHFLRPDKGNGWKWCFFKGALFQNAWTFCFMMNTAWWFSFTQSVVVRVKHINIVSYELIRVTCIQIPNILQQAEPCVSSTV